MLDLVLFSDLLHIAAAQKFRGYNNFSRVGVNLLNFVVCFLLGNSPAPEVYVPTFRNTLSIPSS
jgi:hypothetical protein